MGSLDHESGVFLTEAEYLTWLQPAVAIERMSSLHENTAKDELLDRLQGGTLRSVAETARDRRPIPKAKLESWAAIFNECNLGASEAQARTAFDATFSRHSVTVRELRRVLPERRPGRPLKIQEE